MKQPAVRTKNILLFFSKHKMETFILALLFFWFAFSVAPFPFVQCSDGYWLWIPRLTYAAGEILNGRIPIWNEYQFCGTTFLADGNTNILNPITIFYFFMSSQWAYTLGVMILFLTLIIGTWTYFRERGFSKTASIVGTIGYVYGGQIIFWSIYHGMNLSLVLFPLTLFAFRRFEKTNKIRWKNFAFISMFLSAVGGFIQFTLISAISIIIEGIDSFSFDNIKKVLKNRFFTVFLAVSSASFIIIPTIEAGIFSHRKLIPYFTEIFPTKFHLMLLTFWGTSFREHHYPNYFYYIGIVLIAWSIFAFRKHPRKIFLQPYFVYSLIFPAILIFIYTGILPIDFQFGVQSEPWRGMFVFILALSILAAIGTEIYIKQLKSKNKLVLPPFEIFIAGLASIYIGLYRLVEHNHNAILDKIIIIIVGFLMLSGYVLSIVLRKRKPEFRVTIFTSWLVFLMIVNSFQVSNAYLATNVTHRVPLDPWKREKLPTHILSNEGRFVDLRLGNNHLENWGINNKIRALGGYGSFFPKSIFLRMKKDRILPYEFNAATHFKNNSFLNPYVLARYGVLYLIIDKELLISPVRWGWQFDREAESNLIYKNPKYVGRAYIIDKEGRIIKGANIVQNTDSYVKISVNANAGDVLILADSWFPGWECYNNGKKVKYFDADGFRGYHIEKTGLHKIEWIYKPLSFLIGFVISGISLIAFLLLICIDKLRRNSKIFPSKQWAGISKD